jgi:hypothetical protein
MAKNNPNRPLKQSFQQGCAHPRYTTFDNISFFIPCPNSRHTQRYCAKAECRKASKAAAQAKWLNKAENRSYFRGPENVERVQRWRERHPGYWRKKRSPPDALQDLALSEVSQNQPITLNGIDHVAKDCPSDSSWQTSSRTWPRDAQK